MRTETSQLTEDNEDFAGRGRYHQSEIVQGKHFDDDFPSDWDSTAIVFYQYIFSRCVLIQYDHVNVAKQMWSLIV